MPRKSPESVSLGERIRTMRTKQKLSLEDFASQTGYDADYIEKIESGEVAAPVGTLIQLSRVLSVDTSTLLSEERKKERRKNYRKRTKAYSYTTLTPGAEDKHLWAYKVTLQPKKEHEKVQYQHEGEEFVYVLEGRVQVTVGGKENALKKGDTLHFMSNVPHTLKNLSTKSTKLLVVVYTP